MSGTNGVAFWSLPYMFLCKFWHNHTGLLFLRGHVFLRRFQQRGRVPYPALPVATASSSNRRISCGSYSRSASYTMTQGVVTVANPSRTAIDFPPFVGRCTTRVDGDWKALANSPEPSVEPSSTTINRQSPRLDAPIRERTASIVAASLKQCTTTERRVCVMCPCADRKSLSKYQSSFY